MRIEINMGMEMGMEMEMKMELEFEIRHGQGKHHKLVSQCQSLCLIQQQRRGATLIRKRLNENGWRMKENGIDNERRTPNGRQ
jgi:hypothetical protein